MPVPYDLDAATAHLSDSDPAMATWIARIGPCALEVRPMASLFEGLLRSIVYQQLSGKAAATIHGRVRALFPADRPTVHHFASLDDEVVRAAGISRAKLAALRDLAYHIETNRLPDIPTLQQLDDATVAQRLTAVRGIGPWTAEMLLIFRLGRPDVWPVTDLGVRKGIARLDGRAELPTPQQARERGEVWRPYRSVASWYLWRVADA